jgi:hypothetical protein
MVPISGLVAAESRFRVQAIQEDAVTRQKG